MQPNVLWINGEYKFEHEATVQYNDRGLLLGDGVFTTLRAQRGQLECFESHYQRLKNNAAFMFLGVTQGIDEIKQITHGLLERNTLSNKTAAIRITLTRGPGPRGLSIPENPRPTTIITGSEYTPPKGNFRCNISAIRRPQADPLKHIKHLGYGANIIARELSRQLGFDECLMCNEHGFLNSASAGNIFYSINQNWYTPPLSDGALPGIMRGRILRENPNIKIAQLNISEIERIDGLFISNSLIGAHPVSVIEQNELKTEAYNFEQFRAYQCPAQ